MWEGEIAIEGFATMYVFFKQNLINSAILSVGSVSVTLLLGVPAAYAFARYKFKGEPLEDLQKAQWYLNRLVKEVSNGAG